MILRHVTANSFSSSFIVTYCVKREWRSSNKGVIHLPAGAGRREANRKVVGNIFANGAMTMTKTLNAVVETQN